MESSLTTNTVEEKAESSKVVSINNKGLYFQIMKRHPRFLMYIQKHMNTGVIHMYYGKDMMSVRQWKITPYDLKLDDNNVLSDMEAFSIFAFVQKCVFIIYNGTRKPLKFCSTYPHVIVCKI
nr:hypothetical protein MmNV_71 [Menippe mercenaria nudivirus]